MLLRNDEYFMRQALKEAQKAFLKGEVPVGCVIVRDGKIIARAHNQKEGKKLSLAHAEILAIHKACQKLGVYVLDDCTIYVTLEPCLMCTGAILLARMKRLVYGTTEPKFGSVESVAMLLDQNQYPYNHQIEVTNQCLQDECSQLMKSFFRDLRNNK